MEIPIASLSAVVEMRFEEGGGGREKEGAVERWSQP